MSERMALDSLLAHPEVVRLNVSREQIAATVAAIRQAEADRIAALRVEYAEVRSRDHERYHSEPPPKRPPPGYYGCVGCWACGGSFEAWAGRKRLDAHVLNLLATEGPHDDN